MTQINSKVTAILRRPDNWGDMKTIDLVGEDGKTAYTLQVRAFAVETRHGYFNQSQVENMGSLIKILSNVEHFVDQESHY